MGDAPLVHQGSLQTGGVVWRRQPGTTELVLHNNGNGNCFFHTAIHALSWCNLSEITPPDDMVLRLKALLADAVVRFVTDSRLPTLEQLAALRALSLSNNERKCKSAQVKVYKERLRTLDLLPYDQLGDSTDTSDWLVAHLLPAVSEVCKMKQSQSLLMWAMLAQKLEVSVTIWEPSEDGGRQVMRYGKMPMVFAPTCRRAPGRHLDVLWHSCGYPTTHLGTHGPSGEQRTWRGNHYALLLPAGASEPSAFDVQTVRGIGVHFTPVEFIRPISADATARGAAAGPSLWLPPAAGARVPRGARAMAAASASPVKNPYHKLAPQAGSRQQGSAAKQSTQRPSQSNAQPTAGDGAARSTAGRGTASAREAGSKGRPTLQKPIYKSINDSLLDVLDGADVTIDQLIRYRFYTTTNALRSTTQKQQRRLLVEFATGEFADALDRCRQGELEHSLQIGNAARAHCQQHTARAVGRDERGDFPTALIQQ